jgi:ABC-2 type transport system ATP-binding protein
MDSSDIIQVDNLRRQYRLPRRAPFDAVRGVSSSVRRGELFALLGTNGAGKTSILEVLEGLAVPSAGTVRVLGRDPARDRRFIRPRTGVVLQEGGLPSGLTVGESARPGRYRRPWSWSTWPTGPASR